MFRDEFQVVAKGSNECTNISGSRDYGTTGGHVDTNNQRMISHYGLEDCCGYMWQWTRDLFEYYPGATWNDGDYWLSGYQWQDIPVYNETVDIETKYGPSFGLLRRLFVSGSWHHSLNCGSRSIHCYVFSASGFGDVAARGCSDSL